jgi:hypothetical protein
MRRTLSRFVRLTKASFGRGRLAFRACTRLSPSRPVFASV